MTEPLPVLHIVPKLVVGGVQTQLFLVLRNYDRSKFSVTVCSLYDKGDIGIEMEKAGIDVICLHKSKNRFDWTIIRELYRLMKRKNIKIVRTHRYSANLYGRIAAIFARVPCIIASVHNIYIKDRKLNRRIMNNILSRFSDAIVAVSETVKKDILKYDRIPEGKVKVIFNGIDMKKFLDADGRRIREELNIGLSSILIGSVGRLTEQKGVTYLIEAMPAIIKNHPDAYLLLTGDGEGKDVFRALAKKLGVEDHVIFAGWRSDIPDILNALDIFVFPSLWEGLPNALIEAMAAGRPIVASDIPPIKELVVSMEDGILVSARKSEAIASAVKMLIEDRSYAAKIGNSAQIKAKGLFAIESTIGQYVSLFHHVMGGTRSIR